MKRVILIVVLAVVFRFPAYGQFAEVSQPQSPADAVVQFLGFSEQQAADFRLALIELQSSVTSVQARIAAKQRELASVLSAQPLDEGAAGRLIVEIALLQKDHQRVIQRYHLRFTSLLNPEQAERVKQVVQARDLLPAVAVFAAVQLVAPPATQQN